MWSAAWGGHRQLVAGTYKQSWVTMAAPGAHRCLIPALWDEDTASPGSGWQGSAIDSCSSPAAAWLWVVPLWECSLLTTALASVTSPGPLQRHQSGTGGFHGSEGKRKFRDIWKTRFYLI